ncbi:SDR family NAD(P)-dependent oxidoreductase [Flavobacterium alkalisoli]|uniref:SDR family NAD(P)-dependent oxidoreductase n=1 Tax=Flavobacterium alkalisoli TaxID=2602769 RepID=UPI003A90D03E
MDTKKVWFITGASKGLGLEFVKQLLEKGNYVAATSRSIAQLETAAGKHDNFLPLEVNLSSEESVEKAINATIEKFGHIDNVVNNAGYGLVGSLEELTDAEARQNFEVNVFGTLNIIRKVMPYLRKQQSGHIFNISSIGGFVGNFPGFGIYCATKFAMAGFTEALAAEAKDFNINVTLVLPGYFRTNFLNSDSLAITQNPMEEYKSTRDSQAMHQNTINGNQQGDPVKGVTAMIKASETENPPLYLYLGSDSVSMAQAKIEQLSQEIKEWESLSRSTDF